VFGGWVGVDHLHRWCRCGSYLSPTGLSSTICARSKDACSASESTPRQSAAFRAKRRPRPGLLQRVLDRQQIFRKALDAYCALWRRWPPPACGTLSVSALARSQASLSSCDLGLYLGQLRGDIVGDAADPDGLGPRPQYRYSSPQLWPASGRFWFGVMRLVRP